MPVDNDLYNREAKTWWADGSFLSILRVAVNPVRLEYLRTLESRLGLKPASLRVLDVGCGGGYLAEELAKLGFNVTGVDPSPGSIAAAQAHAKSNKFEVTYQVASAESLPFPDASFDMVTCCDVLEHVASLDQTLKEISRMLRPGGVFMYDTINRNFMTWLAVIFVAQEFPPTRFFPPGTHDWHLFIRPEELGASLTHHGISNQDINGMAPSINILQQFWLILKLKYGCLDYRNYGQRTRLHLSKNMMMNYIGFGIKDIG